MLFAFSDDALLSPLEAPSGLSDDALFSLLEAPSGLSDDALFSLLEAPDEPYPSSYHPPPFSTKEVRDIWRRVSSESHDGQGVADSSVIDFSTVNSVSQGSHAYS